jgi:pimeloyl-ACP methyl ester carboxylesterase
MTEAPRGARWFIGGNSLGGLLALELACRLPESVAHVTLAALALPLRWGRSLPGLMELRQYGTVAVPWLGRRLVTRYVRARGVPGVVDDPIRLLFRDPTRLDAEVRRRLIAVSEYRLTWADEAARAYEQATRSLALSLLSPHFSERWLRNARCPVLSIHGTHDPLYPAAAWQRLAATRPDWQHVRLDDIGHVPQLEAPEAFLEHMLLALGAAIDG